jgi:hypothetical protein
MPELEINYLLFTVYCLKQRRLYLQFINGSLSMSNVDFSKRGKQRDAEDQNLSQPIPWQVYTYRFVIVSMSDVEIFETLKTRLWPSSNEAN